MPDATLIDVDPRKLAAHPSNPRVDFGDLDELAGTIGDPDGVGLLQPLVVVPADGGYRIVAGHRRNAAAIQAQQATVLAVVRADLADKAPEQIAAALTENGQRKDLTPSEEAAGFVQLAAFDWAPERMAKVTGRSVPHVRNALTLARLPEAARDAADRGQLDLDQAAAFEEFADDAAALDRLIKKGTRWGFQHALAEERRLRQDATRRASVRAELDAAGVKVVSKPKSFPYNSQMQEVRWLRDADGNELDPAEVMTRDGFAAIIDDSSYGSTTGYFVVCLNPEADGYRRVGYTNYVSPEERARRDAAAEAEREWRAVLEDAATVRWHFICQRFGSAKGCKSAYLDALRCAVSSPRALELAAPSVGRVRDIAGAELESATTAGDARLSRLLVARWVVAQEDNVTDVVEARYSGSPADALAWLDRLVSAGYELSDAESTLRERLIAAAAEDQCCPLCGADVDEVCDDECPNLTTTGAPDADATGSTDPVIDDAAPGEENDDGGADSVDAASEESGVSIDHVPATSVATLAPDEPASGADSGSPATCGTTGKRGDVRAKSKRSTGTRRNAPRLRVVAEA